MLNFKSWIVQTLISDATMQSFLLTSGTANKYNVFPVDIDIQPEQFPCIIYQDAGVSVLSRPQGMHVGNFQIDVYSTVNALEVENIYARLAQLLNFQDSTLVTQPVTGKLWWIREQNVKDMHDAERRLWRKVCTYKYWYSNTDNS